MKKLLYLVFFLFLLGSCKNNPDVKPIESERVVKEYDNILQLQWLLGTWVHESKSQFSKETWIKENDSTLSSYSYTQVGNDTVFAETMLLQQKEGNLFLTAAEADENNRTIVTFNMIPSEKGKFVFENKEHDFPQRIIYTNPTQDSIHAWIEGTINGMSKTVDFYFTKKN